MKRQHIENSASSSLLKSRSRSQSRSRSPISRRTTALSANRAVPGHPATSAGMEILSDPLANNGNSAHENAEQEKHSRRDTIDGDEDPEPEQDPYQGLSEQQIFRLITRPRDIPGLVDWGIPSEVDPEQADPALRVSCLAIAAFLNSGCAVADVVQAKVDQFLRLKYEKGQHINSTLLASSTFANPHIYAKLVSPPRV